MRTTVLILLLLPIICGKVSAEESKPFSTQLMLENQAIGEVRFSADGSRLYLDRVLPYKNKQHFDWDRDWGRSLTVLSIFDTSTSENKVVSNSETDRTWYLASSPSGKYVAFGWLDGRMQRVGIREIATGKERRLQLAGNTSTFLVWLSDDRFATMSMGADVQEQMAANGSYAVRKIASMSEESWNGSTSVKVAGSGRYKSSPNETPIEMALVDARTGEIQIFDRGTIAPLPKVAPNGRRLAYLRKKNAFDTTGLKMEAVINAASVDELLIYDLESKGTTVKTCDSCSVNNGSLRWSPSGDQLFYTARSLGKGAFVFRHFVYNVKTGKSTPFYSKDSGWDTEIERARFVAPLVWLDEDHFALRLRNKSAGEFADQEFRWYLARKDGSLIRELTSGVPRGSSKEALKLPVGVNRGSLLLISDGQLWRISQNGIAQNMSRRVANEVDTWCAPYAYWRTSSPRCDALETNTSVPAYPQSVLDANQIALRTMRDAVFTGEFLFLDLVTGQATRIARPSPDSEPLEVSASGKAVVFERKGMEGDQVILLRQGGEPKIVHQFNTHLAGVREAKKILLNRREPGEDEDRNDWLLLPPDHKPGERHPLLVYFYPDKRYGKELRGDDLRDFSFVNMNIPTARGYAVLLASMKISDLGKAIGNPMREMHEQLIRAAENAVAKGYVYSDRWAIMGHSYGGYGTNSVITQTGRFKAAISMNGLSNLSSGYGIGMNQDKAFAVPEGLNFGALWSEGGQGRMGVAPWQDPQRYVDNSPVFWAHQITTPLMLIHGDQDFVNINEAEQLFAALYRQGKDAQLLRYWGEGHEYSSPGNITDMWERIFVFLDENLNKSAAPTFHGLGQAPSAIN